MPPEKENKEKWLDSGIIDCYRNKQKSTNCFASFLKALKILTKFSKFVNYKDALINKKDLSSNDIYVVTGHF